MYNRQALHPADMRLGDPVMPLPPIRDQSFLAAPFQPARQYAFIIAARAVDCAALMIALQIDHTIISAGKLKRHQPINHTMTIRPAVDHVANMHQRHRRIRMEITMMGQHLFMQCAKSVILTVHIADGVEDAGVST